MSPLSNENAMCDQGSNERKEAKKFSINVEVQARIIEVEDEGGIVRRGAQCMGR